MSVSDAGNTVSRNWIVSSLGDSDDDDANVGTARGSLESIPTHLFLHFDINETILLGDDAGGDSGHESAQKMLAKSAFCRIPTATQGNVFPYSSEGGLEWMHTTVLEPTHWWDGQEIGKESSMPPLYTGWKWPKGACPYYRTAYKKFAKTFTNDGSHGEVYKPLLKACEAALMLPVPLHSKPTVAPSETGEGKRSPLILVSTEESKTNQHSRLNCHGGTILPAFFYTLNHLINNHDSGSQPFTVIFRTFGNDLRSIASVVTKFAEGKHPDFPNVNFPPLSLPPDRLFQGRWAEVSNGDREGTVYQLWTYGDNAELVASGDAEILALLKNGNHASFGIRDDYNFWSKNDCNPTAGKPIWIPQVERDNGGNVDTKSMFSHHLLFDDNIHNLPHDGIACVRMESSLLDSPMGEAVQANHYETIDGTQIDVHHGVNLIRVPTIEPVLNPNWYIEQIDKARTKLQYKLQTM